MRPSPPTSPSCATPLPRVRARTHAGSGPSRVAAAWPVWRPFLEDPSPWIPLQCCRHHQIQFFIISGKSWPVVDFGVKRPSSDLATSISLIHCNASVGFRLRANFCSEVHNSAVKFRVVRESCQMHFRGRITRDCHATLSTSPNSRKHGLSRT